MLLREPGRLIEGEKEEEEEEKTHVPVGVPGEYFGCPSCYLRRTSKAPHPYYLTILGRLSQVFSTQKVPVRPGMPPIASSFPMQMLAQGHFVLYYLLCVFGFVVPFF